MQDHFELVRAMDWERRYGIRVGGLYSDLDLRNAREYRNNYVSDLLSRAGKAIGRRFKG